ncbi:hypothetical protein D3C76_1417550 [compost metagenome]
MHYGNFHAELYQTFGSFKTKKSASDNGRSFILFSSVQHDITIGDVPETDNTFFVMPRYGENEGVGACCNDDFVVRDASSIFSHNFMCLVIDSCNRCSCMQCNAVIFIPVQVVQDDIVQRFASFQYVRQHNAVVVRIGLGAKNGNIKSRS